MNKREQWYCSSCKGYNDILSAQCVYDFSFCQTYRPAPLSRFAGWIELKRNGTIVDLQYPDTDKLWSNQRMKHSEKELEELHARFFNDETVNVVSTMDLVQLEEHIHTLEMIAFEAKVRLQSSVANKRERVAKLRQAERDALISDPNLSGSDALAAIAARQKLLLKAETKAKKEKGERRTKNEKAYESLAALGMSDEAIKAIMDKAAAKADGKPEPKKSEEKTPPKAAQLIKEAIEVISDKPKEEKPNLGFFKFGS